MNLFVTVHSMPRMNLRASIGNLPTLITMVSECAQSHGFPDARVLEVELALEEALTNVCNYAYDGEAGEVEVRCALDAVSDGLVVEIIDSGKPFNPLDAPEPNLTAEVEQRQMGGLGVFLIGKMANDVRYQRLENRNCLRLFFKRRGRDE